MGINDDMASFMPFRVTFWATAPVIVCTDRINVTVPEHSVRMNVTLCFTNDMNAPRNESPFTHPATVMPKSDRTAGKRTYVHIPCIT